MDEADDFMKEKEQAQPQIKKSGVFVPTLTEQYMEEYSAFSVFIGKYGAAYADKDEHMGRFEIFAQNYREMKTHNAKFAAGEVGWEKDMNQFADLTADEFQERYLSNSFRGKPAILNDSLIGMDEDVHRPHMV